MRVSGRAGIWTRVAIANSATAEVETPAGPRGEMRPASRCALPLVGLLCLAATVVLAAGCGLSRASTRSSTTASPTHTNVVSATQTGDTTASTTVGIVVSAKQAGMIQIHDVRVDVQVVAANSTGQPIEITYPCGQDPIQVTIVEEATGQVVYMPNTYSCPPKPNSLYPPVVANGTTHDYSLSVDLSHATLEPGQYVIKVSFSWIASQGGTSAPNPSASGHGDGQTTVTLA